jgi:dienelactone hydrolase
MSGDRSFAAYLAFYPATCNRILLRERNLINRPLRIFHGTADDWTPIESCREYVQRMRRADLDVELLEYENAPHAFDNPNLPPARFRPNVLNASGCVYIEREPGRFRAFHRATKERASPTNPCVRRGATVGHHPGAYKQAIEDVRAFIAGIFNLGAGASNH